MTTISHDDIGGARKGLRRPRSAEEPAARRSRFWVWASAAWFAAVAITALVAADQAVTVAIGGMTLVALGYALARPEPGAALAEVKEMAAAAPAIGPELELEPQPLAVEL